MTNFTVKVLCGALIDSCGPLLIVCLHDNNNAMCLAHRDGDVAVNDAAGISAGVLEQHPHQVLHELQMQADRMFSGPDCRMRADSLCCAIF